MARTAILGGAAVLALLAAAAGANAARDGHLPQGGQPVQLDPDDLSTKIDNPYRPLRPGDRWRYRETDPEAPKVRVVVTVTDETKTVANGATARVVHAVERESGEVTEQNYAWYAQDKEGNVWYLGEDTREIENGDVTSTKGSWEAGVDGAQPGVAMPAHPRVGLTYREEHYKGVAEDRAEVFSLRERVEVPFRRFGRGVLLIKEASPLEPELLDYKFYAKGVGQVLGIEVSGASGREELVSFRRGRR